MNTNIMERPKCNQDGHGYMELRPINQQTPEQKFCGVWYDCLRCGSSVLFQSPELIKQLSEMSSNAEAQLPPERPKAAEGTQSALALWAVNCSDLLG
jgi:hypothetical protein